MSTHTNQTRILYNTQPESHHLEIQTKDEQIYPQNQRVFNIFPARPFFVVSEWRALKVPDT